MYCSPVGWCMVILLTLVTNPVAAAARNANTRSARGSSIYNSIFWASDTLKAGCSAGAVGGVRGCSAADVATIVMPVFPVSVCQYSLSLCQCQYSPVTLKHIITNSD